MDIFREPKTDTIFFVPNNSPIKKIDINFIDWISQFINDKGVVIDMIGNIGEYTLILSKLSGKIYCYEDNEDLFNCISAGILANKSKNVKISQIRQINEEEYINNNVDLILIKSEHVDKIIQILSTSNYPTCVIMQTDDQKHDKLTQMGYKITKISGTDRSLNDYDYYIASDNTNKKTAINFYKKSQHEYLTEDDWIKLTKNFRESKEYYDAFFCSENISENNINKYIELSIICYFLNKIKTGYKACEKILMNNEVQWQLKNLTLGNLKFYVKPLQFKNTYKLSTILPANYTSSNASIIPLNADNYIINIKCVNYYLNDEGYGVSNDSDSKIRTINKILHVTKDFNINNSYELKDNSETILHDHHIMGYEDLRLINENEFFCCSLQTNEKREPQICYGKREGQEITKLIPLTVTEELQCEKNWLPFEQDGDIYFIYKVSPLTIYKLNKDTGETILHKSFKMTTENLEDFRGSAPPIKFNDGWLLTIHQVHYNKPRIYYHRFVYLSSDFTIMRFSNAFYFDTIGIEFNIGLAPYNSDELLMIYSVRDIDTYISSINIANVSSMLKNEIQLFPCDC